MSALEDTSEKNHDDESIESSDEGSDSSSLGSLSLPGPLKLESSDRAVRVQRRAQERSVHCENSVSNGSVENPLPPLLFNPNEKGTKKQKRCDYDSDVRSYDGLGFEYKRRYLPSTAKRDTLLPSTTRMIDFDHQGGKTWGRRLLFETLNNSEIDSLVGMATSQIDRLSSSSNAGNTSHNLQRQNPLLLNTYDAPLPPSHIDYIRSRIRKHVLESTSDDNESPHQKKRKNMNGEKLKSPLNDSAGVAMGMFLEECITASLLPLAGLHVVRCRALEAMESEETEYSTELARAVPHPITGETVDLDMNNQIRWKEEEAFQEWTLPPEEAILKLMEQGLLSNDAPYQFVPGATASTRSNQVPTSSNCDVASWANVYKVDPKLISANREIFDIFFAQTKNANVEKLRKDN